MCKTQIILKIGDSLKASNSHLEKSSAMTAITTAQHFFPDADSRLLVTAQTAAALSLSVTRRIKWNMPELHTAQTVRLLVSVPLYHCSHATLVINTRYSAGWPGQVGRASVIRDRKP